MIKNNMDFNIILQDLLQGLLYYYIRINMQMVDENVHILEDLRVIIVIEVL